MLPIYCIPGSANSGVWWGFLNNWQVAQLSQRDRAAECLSFRNNVSAKSVHLTSIYPTALTVDPKFQVEGVAPTNHSSSQKTRLKLMIFRTV